MEDYKSILIPLIKELGRIQLAYFGEAKIVEKKGKMHMVTDAEKESTDFLIYFLKKNFPSHQIITEETGKEALKKEKAVIADELDGTVPYLLGDTYFAESIAVVKSGKSIFGVVYAPALDELYYAEKGKGAFLNDQKIEVTKIEDLNQLVIQTDWPWDLNKRMVVVKWLKILCQETRQILIKGSAALGICHVASSKIGAYFHPVLKPWDKAAAGLIAEEAKAKVTDLKGNLWSSFSPEILVANKKLHSKILKIKKGVR